MISNENKCTQRTNSIIDFCCCKYHRGEITFLIKLFCNKICIQMLINYGEFLPYLKQFTNFSNCDRLM